VLHYSGLHASSSMKKVTSGNYDSHTPDVVAGPPWSPDNVIIGGIGT